MKQVSHKFKNLEEVMERTSEGDVNISINRSGLISVQDHFQLSDVFCTDCDNENTQFPYMNKGETQMKKNNQKIPTMSDMIELKSEIKQLNEREQELSGLVRVEFRRQISEIRRLYKLLKSEVLDPETQVTSRFASMHRNILRKNWNKMHSYILMAESYCG